jgi:23S rRNA (cytosine1962-C5)-methyltransferase
MPPVTDSSSVDLERLVFAARLARNPLLQSGTTTACRLFHGAADGVDGLVIEQYGDVLIVQCHPGRVTIGEAVLRPVIERLCADVNARAVYRKMFVPDRAATPAEVAAMHLSSQPWIGEAVPAELTIVENGLRFIIRPYDGFSVGLFLENRDNRRRVGDLASGRRVLNAFSYTCGFSVAAAAGGAATVASVDLSRRYLEWGKRNFEANSIPQAGHLFFCSDTFEFYRRAARQHRRYDLIILDPPTFARARRPRTTFVLDEQLPALLSGAMELLEPAGLLLVATNARQIGLGRLEQELHAAAGSRPCTILERPSLPPDFPGDPEYARSIVARVG